MLTLTDAFLQPEPGTITYWPADMDSPVAGTCSIGIPLKPWSADDEFEPDTFRPGADGPNLIRTSITLEFIDLPAESLNQLAGRTMTLSPNQQSGFAGGSIYLLACHCPIDTTRIKFHAAAEDRITAELNLVFDFVRARGIDIHNRTAKLHVLLHLTGPNQLREQFEKVSQ